MQSTDGEDNVNTGTLESAEYELIRQKKPLMEEQLSQPEMRLSYLPPQFNDKTFSEEQMNLSSYFKTIQDLTGGNHNY